MSRDRASEGPNHRVGSPSLLVVGQRTERVWSDQVIQTARAPLTRSG